MKRNVIIAALLGIGLSAVSLQYFQKIEAQKEIHELFEGEEEENEEEEEKAGHQSGADKQLQGWFWSKGYPNPDNLGEKYMAAYEQYIDIKANTQKLIGNAAARTTATFGNWSAVGTSVAGIGGRVVCIAINPAATSTLVIGTASGGLYKSTNGGSNWTYLPTGFPVLGVGAVAFNASGNVLLAGTGEVYRVEGNDRGNVGFNVWKCRGTYGIGILRSTDGGTTWTRVLTKQSSQLFAIQKIVFDPNNANTVYACATDGLYKSTDGGVTWPSTPMYAKTYVRDMAINPSNSQQMVISVGNLVNTDKGVYRTTDGGATWSLCSGIASFDGYIKLSNSGSRLYASVGIGSGNELYMTSDFGATWYAKTGSAHCGGQYWFAHAVAADPLNANKVVMGGVTSGSSYNYYTYTSSNATTGGTRTTINSAIHADVHDIEYQPGSSSVVYIAHDGGMSKSTDGAVSFSDINTGLNATQFYASFATSPTSANVMIGGLQDNGVVKWNGTSWSKIVGGDGGPSMFHPTDGNRALYSNDARAVYLSTDGGATETQKMANLGYGYSAAYDDRTAFMSPVAISNASPSVMMYVASDNLHISSDLGGTFSRTSPTGTGTAGMNRPIDATYKPAIAMAVSPTNNAKLYVSTSPLSQRADDALNVNTPAKVMRSVNATDNTNYSFTDLSTGKLPDRMTTDFAISESDDNVVFITMGGFGSGHVYLTTDGGTTWQNRSSGLPDVPFNAILIDPVRPNVIYAGCDFGVYVSHNYGINWYDYNAGFPETVMVMDLQTTADNQLVAASHGKGIFRTALFVPPAGLPVNFQTFDGTHTANQNVLNWTVSEERNVKHYEVERSDDGVSYKKIGTVTANSNSGRYSYTDRNLNTGSTILYYRLKSVDNDAAYFYSTIVSLRNEEAGSRLQVLSNPFTTSLRWSLSSPLRGKVSATLYALSGSVVKQSVFTMNGPVLQENLSTAELLRGIYILEVCLQNQRWTQRVIKQ